MADEYVAYKVAYRKVKYPRLEFRTKELLVVLPFGQKPEPVLEKHHRWIKKKAAFIDECLRNSAGKEVAQRTNEELKQCVHAYADEISRELNVKPNKIRFRQMKTKWASCNSKKNISINKLMKHLPDHLLEYVIFHEMTHLVEMKHNSNFWSVVASKFHDYKELEKELLAYWFLVQEVERSA